MAKRLTTEQRREIFRELVHTQDITGEVQKSRQKVSKKFGISEAQLRLIEDEGIEHEWPPLDEEPATTKVAGI